MKIWQHLAFHLKLFNIPTTVMKKTWYRVKIEKTTNNLYLSEANPGYEVRGEACDTIEQKKTKKDF